MTEPTKNVVCHSIFPTPVWFAEPDLDNESLLEYIYAERDRSPGRDISNIGGWQSNGLDPNEPALIPLLMTIKGVADQALASYQLMGDPQVAFVEAWANINRKGDINAMHNHLGHCRNQAGVPFFSGVYYVKTSGGSGHLVFQKEFQNGYLDFPFQESVGTVNEYNSPSCTVVPRTGQMHIFPARLLHRVEPTTDDEDRVSISFNLAVFPDYEK